ncbi:hypothetical protein EDC04DRAFT_2558887 [Pisolithus marmoratus]|nr:hypothetical protein EDC04DRAFT_2558887 [Pisolithus marmoratus]
MHSARELGLSNYVSLCYGCSLVLCNLNLPHYPCPHCGESFLDKLLKALVAQILEELGAQVTNEDEEQHQTIEEAHKAERAHSPCFPVPVVHREHVGQLARVWLQVPNQAIKS